MARRKKDELPPNVRKRGKGYTYRYDVPVVDANGIEGRKQKDTVQFPTPEAAYEAGIVIEAQIINGTFVDAEKSFFPSWAPKMLAYHVKLKKLRLSTADTYESLLSHAILYFAKKRVKDIKPGDYQDFLFWLQEERELGPASIRSVHAVMSCLFKHGVKRGQLSVSPCVGADMPKEDEIQSYGEDDEDEEVPKFLEKDQLANLIKVVKQFSDQADNQLDAFKWRQFGRILFVLCHSGMRVGEMAALEEFRVDLANLTIRVRHTLYAKRGLKNYHLGPPKTKESRRTIDISKRLAAVFEAQKKDLRAFRLLVGEKYHTAKSFWFVMSSPKLPGYPIRPATVNKLLEEALEAAGMDPKFITAHGLRHTFTSLSAEAGVTLEDIRRQLGHANDKITERVYRHVTQTRRKANVDKLDALLGDLW